MARLRNQSQTTPPRNRGQRPRNAHFPSTSRSPKPLSVEADMHHHNRHQIPTPWQRPLPPGDYPSGLPVARCRHDSRPLNIAPSGARGSPTASHHAPLEAPDFVPPELEMFVDTKCHCGLIFTISANHEGMAEAACLDVVGCSSALLMTGWSRCCSTVRVMGVCRP